MVSQINDLGLQGNRSITLFKLAANEVALEAKFKGEIPFLIQFPFNDFKRAETFNEF